MRAKRHKRPQIHFEAEVSEQLELCRLVQKLGWQQHFGFAFLVPVKNSYYGAMRDPGELNSAKKLLVFCSVRFGHVVEVILAADV